MHAGYLQASDAGSLQDASSLAQLEPPSGSEAPPAYRQLDWRLTALEQQVRHLTPPASANAEQQQQQQQPQPQPRSLTNHVQAGTISALNEDGRAEPTSPAERLTDGLVPSSSVRRGSRKRKADTRGRDGAGSGAHASARYCDHDPNCHGWWQLHCCILGWFVCGSCIMHHTEQWQMAPGYPVAAGGVLLIPSFAALRTDP